MWFSWETVIAILLTLFPNFLVRPTILEHYQTNLLSCGSRMLFGHASITHISTFLSGNSKYSSVFFLPDREDYRSFTSVSLNFCISKIATNIENLFLRQLPVRLTFYELGPTLLVVYRFHRSNQFASKSFGSSKSIKQKEHLRIAAVCSKWTRLTGLAYTSKLCSIEGVWPYPVQ